jgi:aspartyl-tRNA(Asn)/glutamyl-tRNA(Gln) amidotransferase subunit A
MSDLQDSLVELIRRTSAEIPDDVQRAILAALDQERQGTIAESTLKIIDVARSTADDYIAAQELRQAFRSQVAAVMTEYDVLAVPTSTVAAAPIATQPAAHAVERRKNASIFNFTGQPAISVPCGLTRAGLPVGLMLAGRPFEDATVLRFAAAFERATSWHEQHPRIG